MDVKDLVMHTRQSTAIILGDNSLELEKLCVVCCVGQNETWFDPTSAAPLFSIAV